MAGLGELLRDFVETEWRRAWRPGARERIRRHPAVVHMQVVGIGKHRARDQRLGVDHPLEPGIGNVLDHRLPVDRHENRGAVAHDNGGRRVLDRLRCRLRGPGCRKRRLEPVERNGGQRPLDGPRQLVRVGPAVVGKSRKLEFEDSEVVEIHQARAAVHRRARASRDHAECLGLGVGELERDRDPERELVAGPRFDLRLVDDRSRVA